MAPGRIVAKQTQIGRIMPQQAGIDGEVERIAARVHHPLMQVIIDDIVTKAQQA
jgi:hypothetical protein